jgi:hypothetical protein
MLFDCSECWSWFCLYSLALPTPTCLRLKGLVVVVVVVSCALIYSLCSNLFLILIIYRGQPGAFSSHLCRVWPLGVLCTQAFPTFLQEDVSRTWTHDPMVTITRQQLYRCARAPLQFSVPVYVGRWQKCWWWAMMIRFSESMPMSNRDSCGYQMLTDPLLSRSLCNHPL